MPGRAFTFGKNGLLVRKALIGGSIQKLLLPSSEARLLRQAHRSRLAEQPREQRAYDALQGGSYWPHMVTEGYNTVTNGSLCLHMGTRFNQRRQLGLFPSAGQFGFVAINKLRVQPRNITET